MTWPLILRAGAALAISLPIVATPALGQGVATSALKGLDSKAPIDVDADRIEVNDRSSEATFLGNVRVRQADLTLESDRIRISYQGQTGGDPQVQRLDADGNVRMTTPSERATSRFAIYDVNQRILTLVGNVDLRRGTTRVAGNRLVINLESGQTVLDGRTAAGAPGARVSGRFAVPPKKN